MLAQQIKEELNSFKMVRISATASSSEQKLITQAGDGSSRALETTHPFLLMIMHPSFGHGVLANTFQPQQLGIGAHHQHLPVVSSVSCSGYYGLVLPS